MSTPAKKQKLIEGAEWVSSDKSSSPESIQDDIMKQSFGVMGSFLLKGASPDFTIVAGEEGDESALKIPVHTFVLRAFSLVFEAMLRESSDKCIFINDVSYDVLLDMVKFLYTAEAPQFDTHPIELLLAVLAADRYAVKTLKQWCAKKVAGNMELNNVVKVMNAAHSVKSTGLYNQCKTFTFM